MSFSTNVLADGQRPSILEFRNHPGNVKCSGGRGGTHRGGRTFHQGRQLHDGDDSSKYILAGRRLYDVPAAERAQALNRINR